MAAADGAPASGRRLRVLVLLAHPRGEASLNGAIAAAYVRGAEAAGTSVEFVDLSQLRFERDVTHASPADQPSEPVMTRLRDWIAWADHLVFVYPTWWGTHPALLKSVLDRALTPGWAFREITGGTGYEGLLKGKTAECLTTMDTPAPVYRFLYRAPGDNCLRHATLGFCGIDVVRITRFTPVKASTPALRERWLGRAEALGRRLGAGARSPWTRFTRKLRDWALAVRPQFYPMTFLAYLLGSLGATPGGGPAFDHGIFWLGYAVLFLIEAATVFANDVHDLESDRRNRFFGPFTGGSRVVVDGRLERRQLRLAAVLAAVAALCLAGVLLLSLGAGHAAAGLILFVTLCLGLGYTVPPAKLSHRSLGEATVALTHSFAVVLAGFVLQGGAALAAWPWLVSLPLFFAVVPAITLSGVPDATADAVAGKATLAVRFGIHRACDVAAAGTVLAIAAAAAVAFLLPSMAWTFLGLALVGAVHGAWLLARILRERRAPPVARRIDGTMAAGLTFIIWFAAIPLVGTIF